MHQPETSLTQSALENSKELNEASENVPSDNNYPKKGSVTLNGQTYSTIQYTAAGLTWMSENLNYEVSDSWCYEEKASNCNQYGRLYTWEAAKRACRELGNGWRLPKDEEWKSLANTFGGYYDFEKSEDVGDPKKAYKALMEGGNSGFSAQLGGWRNSDGSFYGLGDFGSCWSATEHGSDGAWYYRFGRSSGRLGRGGALKSYGHSCRCVQDLTI